MLFKNCTFKKLFAVLIAATISFSTVSTAVLPVFAADMYGNNNLNMENAVTISVNETVDVPCIQGYYYYYKFVPTEDGVYTLTSTGEGKDANVSLYDTNGSYIISSYNINDENKNFSCTWYLLKDTVYYYCCSSYSPYDGSYTATLTKETVDNVYTYGESMNITATYNNNGTNIYKFIAPYSGDYFFKVNVDGTENELYVEIVNKENTCLESSSGIYDDNWDYISRNIDIKVTLTQNETYFIKTSLYTNSGISLELSATYCSHENIKEYPDEPALDCGHPGYDYGMQCLDCLHWFDNREILELPHNYDESFVCTVCQNALEPVKQGICGEDLIYKLFSLPGEDEYSFKQTLIISGTGAMYDYNYAGGYYVDGTAPWLDYERNLQKVIIDEGVTYIGTYAFTERYDEFKEVVFPSTLIEIGEYAFDKCYGLTHIAFPDSLESIGNYAFNDCTGLETVNWGKSTAPYSAEIFTGCNNLNNIIFHEDNEQDLAVENGALFNKNKTTLVKFLSNSLTEYAIPSTVTTIGDYAFYGNESLLEIVIPGNVKTVGQYAFSYTNLESVYIQEGVITLEEGCFNENYSLETVNIAGSVKTVGNRAFSDCWITSLYLGEGIEIIGESAFFYLRTTDLVIPDSVKYIGVSAFDSGYFETLTIGNGVETIDEYAFYGCYNLSEVVLPDSVETVNDFAFAYCESLEVLDIGSNVKNMSGAVFLESTRLYDITVDTNNQYFKIKTEGLYNKDETVLHLYTLLNQPETIYDDDGNPIDGTSFTIPSGVTRIDSGAFGYQGNLTAITFNSKITSIGAFSFMCTGITEIDLPLSVKELGDCAFSSCDNLIRCELNQGLEKIGHSAFFQNGALTSCNLPSSVTYIGNYGFEYCEELNETFILSNNIEYVGDYAFDGCYNLIFYLDLPDSLTYLGSGAFWNTQVKSLTIGNGIATLESSVFADTDIESLVIPENITYIGYNCFGNTPLTSLTIGDGVETIDDEAFNWSALTEVVIPENVETIGYSAFWNDSLLSITIENKNSFIDEDAFRANDGTVIYGYANSTAYDYAQKYSINFVELHEHQYTFTIITEETINQNGLKEGVCSCGDVIQKEIPKIIQNCETYNNFIYGFEYGSTKEALLNKYLLSETSTITIPCEEIVTGTKIQILHQDGSVQELEIVIFGDTTCDGWYDGQDAMVVTCLANGMLTKNDVGEAVYMAADCNHDGVIDQNDIALLEKAGILISSIDQTRPIEELKATATFEEYVELIDQSGFITDKKSENNVSEKNPELNNQPKEKNYAEYIIKIIEVIIKFFKEVISMIPSYMIK